MLSAQFVDDTNKKKKFKKKALVEIGRKNCSSTLGLSK